MTSKSYQDGTGFQRVLGTANATVYPRDTTPYLGTSGTNVQSVLFTTQANKVLLCGYIVDVVAAVRMVCVDHSGADIPGTGITLAATSAPGFYPLAIDGLIWEPAPGYTGAANVGIKLGPGLTATLVYYRLG